MSSGSVTELREFYAFLEHQLQASPEPMTVEESVPAFRAYQRDLQRFRQGCESALAESASGQSQPLDVDAIIDRGRERVRAQGAERVCSE